MDRREQQEIVPQRSRDRKEVVKPLVVGEAPGTYVEGGDPLTGAIGTRIANLIGVTYEEYIERYARVNLFDFEIEGRWPWFDARHRAQDIKDTLEEGQRVVLLGVRVADAFGMLDTTLYTWRQVPGTVPFVQAIRVPHPSGRNRLLNDETHRERFRAALVGASDW